MKKITFILLVGLFIMSCEKEKIDLHPEFIGFWYTDLEDEYREVDIQSSGKSSYKEITTNKEVSVKGRFKIKNGDRLKSGLKGFDIDRFPHISTLNGEIPREAIILDDIIYYKL